MELSSRKTSKRTIEPVDEWLQNEGYYRKHAPKDPTCLFRAISEQVYQNQRCHIGVRKECVDFMKKNKKMFEEKITIPYDSYLEQMACFTEWGGMNEILAMSLLYKRNVVVFHGQKLIRETVIDHGFKENFFLCFTPPKQYETVYSQEHTGIAGFCQSIVYQTLYKNVFKMNNVDVTVHKMLHERNSHLRHDKFFLKGNLDIRNQLTLELLDKIEDSENSEEVQLLSKGITPFPYRVAKALDPNIYRNVDYDIWHEIRKEVRNSGYTKFNSTELQAGAKCLVQLDLKEHDKVNNNFLTAKENWDNNSKAVAKLKRLDPLFYTGHIQEMSKNEGPVIVFVEELGEKMTVPYESLKPYPQKKVKQNNWAIAANKKNMIAQNPKCKKPWNSSGRKIKDQIPNENVDKNQMSNPKGINKNVVNKTEWSPASETIMENHSVKLQVENYTPYKEFSVNSHVDAVGAALENTHISLVETGEQIDDDKKSKSPGSTDIVDNTLQKQDLTNFNHDANQSNKQHNQRAEKNEIFYPPYPTVPYPSSPRFPGEEEMLNYDLVKSLDVEGTDIPYSDPATVRHFFNLGVKYFWTQNMWANGINGQPFGDNSYYMGQPPPELNVNVNMLNGPIPNGENIHQTNNVGGNTRHNNRPSPPRHKDQENVNSNGPKSGGQKLNYRGSELRNSSSPRDSYQSSNVDINRNRTDFKNSNEQQQQQASGSNKEVQRGKSNGLAPRFKKNYEGRNRNEYHNNNHHQYNRQQHQQDYEARNKKQAEIQGMTNQGDMNNMGQMPLQHPNQLQHQQPQSPHHQQPPLMQPQTPPLNGSYPYPVPYNQQVPYMPMTSYPPESEAFPGHYYPPPPGFIQIPYLPPAELPEGTAPCVSPVYPAPIENFPAQYQPVYSQYVYHPPAMYSANQPPGASSGSIPENCFPGPYQGQPYFIPYPPPPVNPQAAPTHETRSSY